MSTVYIEQMTRESEPMRITDYMVEHPCRIICASYVLLLLFAVITGAAGYMMPTLEGGRGRDGNIWKDPIQVDADMLVLAQEYIRDTEGVAKQDLQTENTNTLFILYENEGDNPAGLLNIPALKKMI